MGIGQRRIQREMSETERGNMKGCDYVSKSLSSPLLLPYLSVTKRQAIFEICRTLGGGQKPDERSWEAGLSYSTARDQPHYRSTFHCLKLINRFLI